MPAQFPAFFSDYTQTTRLLRLYTRLGPERLLAESIRGEEAIGEGYAFTITALSLDAGMPRAFHGYLTAAELNGANGGMARYTLTLRPWSAFLAHSRDSRIFQNMSVPDIVDTVFEAWQGRAGSSPNGVSISPIPAVIRSAA